MYLTVLRQETAPEISDYELRHQPKTPRLKIEEIKRKNQQNSN